MPYRTHTSSAAHSLRPTQAPSSTTATATQTLTSTPVLRLRATAPPQTTRRPRIQWAEDVVDNEGLGRKSSKVCCIYHAPRQVGESSDESSSSSDGSSSDEQDSSDDDGAARMSGNRRAQQKPRHEHDKINGDGDQAQPHADVCQDPDHDHGPKGKRVSKRKSGNAYEKMPKSKGNSTTVIEGKR